MKPDRNPKETRNKKPLRDVNLKETRNPKESLHEPLIHLFYSLLFVS